MIFSRLTKYFGALIIVFGATLSVWAQPPARQSTEIDQDPMGSIKGRLIMPDGSPVTEPVRVTLGSMRSGILTLYTEKMGQFEFLELRSATYSLEIVADRDKFEVINETVQVYRGVPTILNITLKPKRTSSRGENQTISVNELIQKIPSKAQKEFDKATLAGQLNKTDEAILHLQSAIAIFPDFVRARNDLATYLLAQGKLAEAEAHLRKAISVDSNSFNPLLNLGIVLVHSRQLSEAETILTRANSLEPNSPSVHLYLGLAFFGQGKGEASEVALKQAYSLGGAKFGAALYHLGQIYLGRGDSASALKSFETYLVVVPDARNADQVRTLIVALRP